MSAAPRFCAGCGAALRPDVRFCGKCGRPVGEAPPQAQARAPAVGQPGAAAGIDRKMLMIGAAVAAVALGAVLFLLLSGGDGDDDLLASGSEVSAAGVTLRLPAGWAFLDNDDRGLVLASQDDDLRARVPQGPRLTVEPGSTAAPDAEALVGAMAGEGSTGAAGLEVVEEPETVPIGALEGVSIELLEDEGGGAVIRRYVIVNVDGTNVYQFVLEAPESKWGSSVDTLETVLKSAAFQTASPAVEAPAVNGGPAEAASQPTPALASEDTAGFETPEQAIYAFFGVEASPIIECSSERAELALPCFHFWGQADNRDLIYQYQTDPGSSWWTLVRTQSDGTFVVEHIAFDTAAIEYAGEPPF